MGLSNILVLFFFHHSLLCCTDFLPSKVSLYQFPVVSFQSPHCTFFVFFVSMVTPGYILCPEDSELRATDKRDHAGFVFLGLGYPT